MRTVLLKPGDEPRIEAFLRAHADSSLFLRSNLRAAGLVYDGQPQQGTWVAQEEQGALVGIVCHAWNGNLLFQAPNHAVDLARFAQEQSRRKVEGLVGPWEQLEQARRALDLDAIPPTFSALEDLFALPLARLIVPSGDWECGRVTPEDVEVAAERRSAFIVEALGQKPNRSRESVTAGNYFVLRIEGRIVSSGCFNAQLPDCVQLGGIYTPPAERNRGHARKLVAGMLREAREKGVTRAVLFTNHDNMGAQRAYKAVGFQRVGDYGLVLWSAR